MILTSHNLTIQSQRYILKKLYKDFQKLRTDDGLIRAAFPGYHRIFGRDSLIVALELLPIEPQIARNVLLYLGSLQAQKTDDKADATPGKIVHEVSKNPEEIGIYDWKWPYYGSIDSTPLFIILTEKYVTQTGDTETIRSLWKQIQLAFQWISTYGDLDHDGLIEYQRQNPKGLFHQAWKDSPFDSLHIKPPVASVEVQGYAYAAYQSYCAIASKLNNKDDKTTLALEKAKLLKQKFTKAFWMPREKYFSFALDSDKTQIKQITSNPGHLLFTGILDTNYCDFIIEKIFSDALWTPYGIRTLSVSDPDFDMYSYHRGSVWPHDNWLIYYGLKSLGYKKYANIIKNALLKAYTEMQTIPELYFVKFDKLNGYTLNHPKKIVDAMYPANALQAWSLGALINMLEKDT